MLLKRKRSEDELSCFGSGAIGYSSPMRSDHGDVMMMDTEVCSPLSPSHMATFSPNSQSRSRSCTPSHLPSRTFKRLRNGRPSDQEVHRMLLAILLTYQPISGWKLAHHIMNVQRTRSRCFIKPSNSLLHHTMSSLHPLRVFRCRRCHHHRCQLKISLRYTASGSYRILSLRHHTPHHLPRPPRWHLAPRWKWSIGLPRARTAGLD